MCWLDAAMGGRMVVAEAARNVVMVGAQPLGITDCLNFGNPNKPEVFWNFQKAAAGMAEACRVLETPVTGGNVSFYNESKGQAIFPSPVVGMIGKIEPPLQVMTPGWKHSGDVIYLAGGDEQHLGGSLFAQLWGPEKRAGRDGFANEREGGPIIGPCPAIDLAAERALQQFVLEANRRSLINAAHDLSEGGLAVALAECSLASVDRLGATIRPPEVACLATWLFSEAPTRALVTCPAAKAVELQTLAEQSGVALLPLGQVGGDRLAIEGVVDLTLADLRRAYETSPLGECPAPLA